MDGDEDGAGREWGRTARRVRRGLRVDVGVRIKTKDASSSSSSASCLEFAAAEDRRVLEGS